jgi:hypothetical protein
MESLEDTQMVVLTLVTNKYYKLLHSNSCLPLLPRDRVCQLTFLEEQ